MNHVKVRISSDPVLNLLVPSKREEGEGEELAAARQPMEVANQRASQPCGHGFGPNPLKDDSLLSPLSRPRFN